MLTIKHTLTLISSSCCNISTGRKKRLVVRGPSKSALLTFLLEFSVLLWKLLDLHIFVLRNHNWYIKTRNKLVVWSYTFTLVSLSHHLWKQLQKCCKVLLEAEKALFIMRYTYTLAASMFFCDVFLTYTLIRRSWKVSGNTGETCMILEEES